MFLKLKNSPSENISLEVIRKLKEGNLRAYRQIYDYYSENLFHFTYSYLKNSYESEEIVQEVFIRIWEIRDEIDECKVSKKFYL